MEKVHYLACCENTILKTLEQAMARARGGEIDSLCLAATLKNGDVMNGVVLSADGPLFTLIGTVESAKQELLARIDARNHQITDFSGAS